MNDKQLPGNQNHWWFWLYRAKRISPVRFVALRSTALISVEKSTVLASSMHSGCERIVPAVERQTLTIIKRGEFKSPIFSSSNNSTFGNPARSNKTKSEIKFEQERRSHHQRCIRADSSADSVQVQRVASSRRAPPPPARAPDAPRAPMLMTSAASSRSGGRALRRWVRRHVLQHHFDCRVHYLI